MGGSFYFKNNKFDAQNLYISNSTSIYYGSIFYVEDRNKNYHSSIENIEVRNIKRTISSDNSGIIAFLIGDVNLVIENFIGSNYKCWKKANCILFSLVNGAFLNLINSKFDDAVIFNEGPFFLKLDSDNLHYPRAHIKNIELTNINHFAEKSSSGLGWIENGELIVENVIYSTNNSMVKISNSFFENINTGVTEGIFVSIYSGLTMDNFDNIQYSNTDENSNLSVIVNKISNSGSLMIANTTFSNLNRYSGFKMELNSDCNLKNVTIENSYFEKGFIYINPKIIYNAANIEIENSLLKNITSYRGTIIHIEPTDKLNQRIIIKNSTFENNVASEFGGIIYSRAQDINENVQFIDCIFINNKALSGNISNSLNIKSEPIISNKDEIIKLNGNNNDFITNPTKINLIKGSSHISIYSGDLISEMFSLIETSNEKLDDLIFYKLTMNDTYNTFVSGQMNYYCWGVSCDLPNFKSKYSKFENYSYPIGITINDCDNETHIEHYRENKSIKSCYVPKCQPSCNKGLCVNDNICDCTGTFFKGKYCNEYAQLKRNIFYDNILFIISSILIICSVFLIGKIIRHRKREIIRNGTIFNYAYVILRTMKRNHVVCLLLDICKKLGFSLVFGSILVKTLRIYNALIFNVIILIFGYYYIYCIRNLKEQYRESTTVPVYTYIIIELLLIFVDKLTNSLIIKDIFNTMGPIIYSILVIFYVILTKLNMLHNQIKLEKELERKNQSRISYKIRRQFDDFNI
ncbi:hypothetical protein H8356DRAFT_919115 [Neocallimastix lanati (nom. inval.)]|uniref:G-protein coupled receptors family 3 profile domain-containing protein n=1 Tax=Neocallimastix californiae TaxID=1754190 RepID=A0A1Y2CXG6_9FUNG|nr:hypothetical protein H8356DRAFT_919115 [Neocallimastix sp. JGI-2020a]ORY51710.1 hypothetical protein LY90DRAFT_508311 [Neocallimastix californiae]|eukprot:ORY51710.1 hypothetical protein LY90DRAFT_508311 [Neocallimastix californiae]